MQTDQGRDFAGLNNRLLVEHVQEVLGNDGVTALLAGTEETRTATELRDDTGWSSYAQFRRLLETAARLLEGHGGLEGLGQRTASSRTTAPEFAELMLSMGNPMVLATNTSDVVTHAFPFQPATMEVLGPARYRRGVRLRPGLEPFPELCSYMVGLAPQAVRLFGLRVLETREVRCVLRGDDDCAVELAWDEAADLTVQRDLMRTRMEIAESRMSAFRETVADVVSSEDLATVLHRIVQGTARAVQAPGFLLELHTLPGFQGLYTHGVSDEQAQQALLEPEQYLCVDVASARQRYGRLMALLPAGPSSAGSRPALEGYAQLAATALDSAVALEQARRQARASEALLRLSRSLAELTSVAELAQRLAVAVPDVVGSDCSAVLLVEDGLARVAASHGYPPDALAELERLAVPVEALRGLYGLREAAADSTLAETRARMKASRLASTAFISLETDGQVLGLLAAAVFEGSGRRLDVEGLAERFAGLAGQASVALRNSRLVEQVRHQSLHDPLTELPNRALLHERAEQMLQRAGEGGTAVAALFLDLDGFKEVNDTYGHDVGDALLYAVAGRLRSAVREQDTVGRLGGDEFVVLVACTPDGGEAQELAERLIVALRAPLRLPGTERPVRVGVSIGVAVGVTVDANDLLRDADTALYRAKAEGKGCHRLFTSEMRAEVVLRRELTDERPGHGTFSLVYQPALDLATETVVGVEALLRWDHLLLGPVSPGTFVPLLEETGAIVEVGRWVLQEACREAAALRAAGHPLTVSVNASVRQLERPAFVAEVQEALRASGLPAGALVLEITETALMRDAAAAREVLTRIRELGVSVAIDDFGTGYSSLAYLRDFPVDVLKIDRAFVAADGRQDDGGSLLHTFVELARSLHLRTVAEGIETAAELERVRQAGCELGQGFLFARPLTSSALTDLLAPPRAAQVPGPRRAPRTCSPDRQAQSCPSRADSASSRVPA